MNKVQQCIFCQKTSRAAFLKTDKINVKRCTACGLIYVSKQKRPGSSDYYSDKMMHNYNAYYRDFRMEVYKKTLERIHKNIHAKKPMVLDIGCSYGWFLDCCKEAGWEAMGIEPSQNVYDSVKKKHHVVCSSSQKFLPKNNKKFDIVTMWNVLEHIQEPKEQIRLISGCQPGGGILLIAVPNADGFINRALMYLNKYSFHMLKEPIDVMFQSDSPYMHLFYYNADHIKWLLESSGYTIVDVTKQEIINTRQLDKRFLMEGMPWWKRHLYAQGLKALNFISCMTEKDEIIITAKKINT